MENEPNTAVRDSLQASADSTKQAAQIAASISETSFAATPDTVKMLEAERRAFDLQHQKHAELVDQVNKLDEQNEKRRDSKLDAVIARLERLETRMEQDCLGVEDWAQYLQNCAAVMIDHMIVMGFSEDQMALIQSYPNPQAREKPSES